MKYDRSFERNLPMQIDSGYDEGLRSYMLKIYQYMSSALIMTGLIAFFASHSASFLNTTYVIQNDAIVGMKPLAWVILFSPLLIVIMLSFMIQKMSLLTAHILFWGYAALIGLSFCTLFLTFTNESMARVLFITAGLFAGMSIYGHTTKKDLTGMSSFLFMGLIGIIIASLVNLFLHSSGLQFIVSILAVLIFIGLTAYDTQKLKNIYYQMSGNDEWIGKIAVMGALTLYLDFINIFLNLLYLFGDRRK